MESVGLGSAGLVKGNAGAWCVGSRAGGCCSLPVGDWYDRPAWLWGWAVAPAEAAAFGPGWWWCVWVGMRGKRAGSVGAEVEAGRAQAEGCVSPGAPRRAAGGAGECDALGWGAQAEGCHCYLLPNPRCLGKAVALGYPWIVGWLSLRSWATVSVGAHTSQGVQETPGWCHCHSLALPAEFGG